MYVICIGKSDDKHFSIGQRSFLTSSMVLRAANSQSIQGHDCPVEKHVAELSFEYFQIESKLKHQSHREKFQVGGKMKENGRQRRIRVVPKW